MEQSVETSSPAPASREAALWVGRMEQLSGLLEEDLVAMQSLLQQGAATPVLADVSISNAEIKQLSAAISNLLLTLSAIAAKTAISAPEREQAALDALFGIWKGRTDLPAVALDYERKLRGK